MPREGPLLLVAGPHHNQVGGKQRPKRFSTSSCTEQLDLDTAFYFSMSDHLQFLDPLLLMSEARLSAGRRVSFLIAEKSYHRSFIGLASKIAQASKCMLWSANKTIHSFAVSC